MKKIIFSLLFMATGLCLTAQASKVYCQLLGRGQLFSTKVTVTIDFGQESGWFKDQRLVDEKGDPITFNSMVDAMNYMGTLGWEFEQAYVITTNGQNVYHWLLSKYIGEEENGAEGIITKQQVKDAQKLEKAAKQEALEKTDL